MAFRIEAAALACLMALPAMCSEYRVRHVHLRNGVEGVLRIDKDSIAFVEAGKHAEHSRTWKFDDIRRLTLGAAMLRVQTYEGRNREWVFDGAPKELAAEWYPVFSKRLDQRFVAALADDAVAPEWQIPAKLRKGVQGALLVSTGLVVFRSDAAGESRTWRIGDIDSVTSDGRFDLMVTTREREFHFELKQALPEARYQELWRRVNRAQGLEILND
ncbi:MAG TPA: hypothetical protein VG456_04995 [Candidatus Sulfopaludibacter sp.]|nr:hypothetical protein [Candidatus Sulfopaludibacter sp.]